MAEQSNDSQSISFQYQILVLREVEKMIDDHARKDKWQYFSHFRASFELLQRHLDMEDLQALEADWKVLKEMIKKLGQDTKKDESVRKKETEELQENFADNHRFYIYKAFTKAGIIRPEQEGTMDFNKHDIEQVKSIIRAGATPSSVDRVIERTEAK